MKAMIVTRYRNQYVVKSGSGTVKFSTSALDTEARYSGTLDDVEEGYLIYAAKKASETLLYLSASSYLHSWGPCGEGCIAALFLDEPDCIASYTFPNGLVVAMSRAEAKKLVTGDQVDWRGYSEAINSLSLMSEEALREADERDNITPLNEVIYSLLKKAALLIQF